jgi:hypothetical protein
MWGAPGTQAPRHPHPPDIPNYKFSIILGQMRIDRPSGRAIIKKYYLLSEFPGISRTENELLRLQQAVVFKKV